MSSPVRSARPLSDRLSPRQLFAADAIGAVLTASLLGLVVVRFADQMGLPERIFHVLAAVVAVYALYSSTMAILNTSRWVVALRVIAGANLAYCGVTLLLIFLLRERVTWLGVAYFVGEAIVIAAIAAFEFRYSVVRGEGLPEDG